MQTVGIHQNENIEHWGGQRASGSNKNRSSPTQNIDELGSYNAYSNGNAKAHRQKRRDRTREEQRGGQTAPECEKRNRPPNEFQKASASVVRTTILNRKREFQPTHTEIREQQRNNGTTVGLKMGASEKSNHPHSPGFHETLDGSRAYRGTQRKRRSEIDDVFTPENTNRTLTELKGVNRS